MFALELASGLDAMGHDNRMVALGLAFDGGRDPDLPALTTHTAIGPRAIVASALHLRRLLAREPFDVVLAHGGSAAQAASCGPRALQSGAAVSTLAWVGPPGGVKMMVTR